MRTRWQALRRGDGHHEGAGGLPGQRYRQADTPASLAPGHDAHERTAGSQHLSGPGNERAVSFPRLRSSPSPAQQREAPDTRLRSRRIRLRGLPCLAGAATGSAPLRPRIQARLPIRAAARPAGAARPGSAPGLRSVTGAPGQGLAERCRAGCGQGGPGRHRRQCRRPESTAGIRSDSPPAGAGRAGSAGPGLARGAHAGMTVPLGGTHDQPHTA